MGNETNPSTTQATNSSSSLDDFNAREYDPSLGEFLTPDPLSGSASAPDTLDAYAYGGDNPFSNPDPTGMCFLGFGHDCPFSDTLDSIQNAGNWVYNHPLTIAGAAGVGIAATTACVFGGCEVAATAAGVGALAELTADVVGTDAAVAGSEGLADAGVEGAADAVEEVQPIAGRMPLNYGYAGQDFPLSNDLAASFPDGIGFNAQGFPDFSDYAETEVQPEGLNGTMPHDANLANEAAGYDETPDGYTWHHVEDGETMQLVDSELHSSIPHTGGAALLRWLSATGG
jgi:RHS repeat-associated protein